MACARRRALDGLQGADRLADELGAYVRRGAEGIVGRGFQTPNHRWIACAALAWAKDLFPELDVMDYVRSILAETMDINEDGEYSETALKPPPGAERRNERNRPIGKEKFA